MKFVKHVWPDFVEGHHHKIVAEKFNQIAEGKIKRLIINMPLDIQSPSSLATCCPLGWWVETRSSRSFNPLTPQNIR